VQQFYLNICHILCEGWALADPYGFYELLSTMTTHGFSNTWETVLECRQDGSLASISESWLLISEFNLS
jgi:hypothetical protein